MTATHTHYFSQPYARTPMHTSFTIPRSGAPIFLGTFFDYLHLKSAFGSFFFATQKSSSSTPSQVKSYFLY